ncbi:hypothetical protein E8E12_003311 [Didymella heteroderae]|uniref:Uncharacterized protein n=1 Tax=Didymella heteroderae TaxID=1769908 RepID=A0A9P4WKE2_9PLEO|nr:hypothetical protein E8E12_003311 [Didymella heteroderae]
MSTYLITGVSRGLGFEFVRQTSEDPKNLVIGLARDKNATEKKVAGEFGDRANVYILTGDLASYESLKLAAAETAKIVGDRGIDYLVASGGYLPLFDAFGPIGGLADKVDELEKVLTDLNQTNIIGNIHLYNLFLPLVLKGNAKKVITLTSGHADLELINNYDIEVAALYSAFKAALNVIVAKYSAQYKKDGVLFVSISPGVVDVGAFENLTPEQLQGLSEFMQTIAKYAPDFKGPSKVDEAARVNIATWKRISIEDGYGGAFISHFGNKQWV